MKHRFNELSEAAEKQGCEVALPLEQGKSKRLVRIEVRSQRGEDSFKIIDQEVVRAKETIDVAADRMLRRMRRDGMLA